MIAKTRDIHRPHGDCYLLACIDVTNDHSILSYQCENNFYLMSMCVELQTNDNNSFNSESYFYNVEQ